MSDDTARAAGEAEVLAALSRMGLVADGCEVALTALAGGVSSDILRVESRKGAFCVKRALPRLRVQADWRAPVERNRWEVEWMRVAGEALADAVPHILGDDRASGMFAMEYLPPAQYPVWKERLREGVIDVAFSAEAGRRIARIHAATARRADIAERFATDHIFVPIRLDPYLAATARRHPDCAPRLLALFEATLATKLALVHGDVSPKNILCGARGPVFLDAECAWYGDPAFDLAFCLNHLLLKCAWRPQWAERYLDCYRAFALAYLGSVNWEAAATLEARAAALLPGLFLARIDGKSPVEYLTEPWQHELVRTVARALLLRPGDRLAVVADTWHEALAERSQSTRASNA